MTNSEKNWTHISYKDKTRIPAAPSVRAGLIICCLSMLSAFSYLSWLHLQSGHLQQLYEYLNTRIYKFKCSTFISLKTEHGHISGLMYSTAVFYISEQRCQDPPRRDAVKMIREQTRLGEKCVCVCVCLIYYTGETRMSFYVPESSPSCWTALPSPCKIKASLSVHQQQLADWTMWEMITLRFSLTTEWASN